MNLSEVVAMGVKDEGVAVRVLEVVMEVLAGQKESVYITRALPLHGIDTI